MDFVKVDVKDRFKNSWPCLCNGSWKHSSMDNRCPTCGWDRLVGRVVSKEELEWRFG